MPRIFHSESSPDTKNEFLQPLAAVFIVPVKQEPEENPLTIDPLAVVHDKKLQLKPVVNLVKLEIKEEPINEESDIEDLRKSTCDYLVQKDKKVDILEKEICMFHECNRNFTRESTSSLMNQQTGEKLLYCDETNTSFTSQKYLMRPKMTLADENPCSVVIFGSDYEDLDSEHQSNVPSSAISRNTSNEKRREVEKSLDVSAIKSRKRLRNEKKWARNVRKSKRSKGEEYVNLKGNIVPAKSPVVELCSCQKKCYLKINAEQQRKLFKEFYELANFDLQTSYLFSLINVIGKSRSYTSNTNSRRHNTIKYHLINAEGVEIFVCKTFFKNTFAISDGRISRLLKKSVTHTYVT